MSLCSREGGTDDGYKLLVGTVPLDPMERNEQYRFKMIDARLFELRTQCLSSIESGNKMRCLLEVGTVVKTLVIS